MGLVGMESTFLEATIIELVFVLVATMMLIAHSVLVVLNRAHTGLFIHTPSDGQQPGGGQEFGNMHSQDS